jgi:type II secretory pathway component PulK
MKKVILLVTVVVVIASQAATASAASNYTLPQQQAIGAAETYLRMGSGFSRSGLIQQLSSKYGDGFSKALAVFAVNHIRVNWYQQAFLAAKGYLKTSHFSRSGLIQQLTSKYGSGFTLAQAVYAVNKLGY